MITAPMDVQQAIETGTSSAYSAVTENDSHKIARIALIALSDGIAICVVVASCVWGELEPLQTLKAVFRKTLADARFSFEELEELFRTTSKCCCILYAHIVSFFLLKFLGQDKTASLLYLAFRVFSLAQHLTEKDLGDSVVWCVMALGVNTPFVSDNSYTVGALCLLWAVANVFLLLPLALGHVSSDNQAVESDMAINARENDTGRIVGIHHREQSSTNGTLRTKPPPGSLTVSPWASDNEYADSKLGVTTSPTSRSSPQASRRHQYRGDSCFSCLSSSSGTCTHEISPGTDSPTRWPFNTAGLSSFVAHKKKAGRAAIVLAPLISGMAFVACGYYIDLYVPARTLSDDYRSYFLHGIVAVGLASDKLVKCVPFQPLKPWAPYMRTTALAMSILSVHHLAKLLKKLKPDFDLFEAAPTIPAMVMFICVAMFVIVNLSHSDASSHACNSASDVDEGPVTRVPVKQQHLLE